MDLSPVKEEQNDSGDIPDYERHQPRPKHMDIQRPWDVDGSCVLCGCCCLRGNTEYWQQTLRDRMRLVDDIKSGSVNQQDADYVEKLIHESWHLSQELEKGQENDSMDEEELINKVRQKVRLEDIQIELKRFEDPYLRMFVHRDLLNPDHPTFELKLP